MRSFQLHLMVCVKPVPFWKTITASVRTATPRPYHRNAVDLQAASIGAQSNSGMTRDRERGKRERERERERERDLPSCAIWEVNGYCTSTFITTAQKIASCAKTCGLCAATACTDANAK